MTTEEEKKKYHDLSEALELHLRKSTFDFLESNKIKEIPRVIILNLILNSYINGLFTSLKILSWGNKDVQKCTEIIINNINIALDTDDNKNLH